MLIKTLAAVATGALLATSAFAQSAREVRGASPYIAIENEPAPKLIVDRHFPACWLLTLVASDPGLQVYVFTFGP